VAVAVNRRDRIDPRTGRARNLRRNATPAERKLWNALRLLDLPPGHFRRQAPIGPYVTDFAHHGLRLIVKLDGDQHGRPEGLAKDTRRTAHLSALSYRVMRFWNHEIADDCDGVVEKILAYAAEPPPTRTLPAASRGEGDTSVAPMAGSAKRGDEGDNTARVLPRADER
jgi:very-short-patch-repair endonuclease